MELNYICSFIIILSGIYIMLFKKNYIKLVMGLCLINGGIDLLLVSVGYKIGGSSSLFVSNISESTYIDFIPQLLAITCILINACSVIIALALIIKYFKSREKNL